MKSKEEYVSISVEEYQDLVRGHAALSEKIRSIRESVSYRLGHALVNSLKSWKHAIRLPKTILQIYADSKAKRNHSIAKIGLQYRALVRIAQAYAKHDVTTKVINDLQRNLREHTSERQLKVASVMDEFTCSSYFPECELLQLTPENCISELEGFNPDFLFIESAWKGKDDLWQGKISNCSQEIIDCIDWCFENSTQTMFWNKEDPVHFNTFIPLAKNIDYVFTTDVDCIPKYRSALGHDRVYLLPFAAQPKHHNPIEKYERKDAFNFAGSYYLRYPERQIDFKILIAAAKSFGPVDIYDRNFDNSHPHYQFPEEYKELILGALPFSEIDKAYKGYRYGINMNTIKQSQSMFARRVFELLASNTVVISNYSRGVKTFFGDLVISSDFNQQIVQGLAKFCADELTFKKFRLLGLRKTMSEHTYAHRLSYIKSRLCGEKYNISDTKIYVFAAASNEQQLESVLSSFNRQNHKNKAMLVCCNFQPEVYKETENIVLTTSKNEIERQFLGLNNEAYCAFLSSNDYYGASYLTDLSLALTYSNADSITKGECFDASTGSVEFPESQSEYQYCDTADLFASLHKRQVIPDIVFSSLFSGKRLVHKMEKVFSIDCFNYCRNVTELLDHAELEKVTDLDVGNFGLQALQIFDELDYDDMSEFDTLVSDGNSVYLAASELADWLPEIRPNLRFELDDDKLSIHSTLEEGKYAYNYLNRYFSREELNLVLNSQFIVDGESTLEDARSVFEFCDHKKQKISHQMNVIDGGVYSLAIPPNCRYIRFGLKTEGSGTLSIKGITLGCMVEVPAAVVGKSRTLVLTAQYPSYEDIYRYGFLHSRLKAYSNAGTNVDIFRLTNENCKPYREFEGIDIAQGNIELLDRTLSTGAYDQVLVHILDAQMWSVLEKYIDNVKVTVWAHGSEIQLWQRRKFELEYATKIEVVRQKKLSDGRKRFWQSILEIPHKNLKMIFVSKYFKDEVYEDFGVSLPPEQVQIIHNYINEKEFPYKEKAPEMRAKILSIRPYASRKYANDLSVKAILELSKRAVFSCLEFCLVGDGILFDELTAPLVEFDNVILRKEFLTHSEIAELHKEYGIFLTPTRMDSQGVSRDEAMSSGLVPVTSNVAAIPEFVDDSCCFLTPSDDFVALADAIEELYNNEQLFIDMSRAASNRVHKQCGFGSTINREITLIQNKIE